MEEKFNVAVGYIILKGNQYIPPEWEPKDQIAIVLEQLREIKREWPDVSTISTSDGKLTQKLLNVQAELQGIDPQSLRAHQSIYEIRTLTDYMLTLARNLDMQKRNG